MEVSLEVILSTSIKRKNPCPRLSWLGQEKEAVFVVDEKNVGKINLRSGRVKKTLLKQSSVVALATSVNGAWLAALHLTGKLTLWNKDLDCLQTVPANGEISQVIGLAQENSLKLYLYVSGEGSRVLLATHTGCVYLWENTEEKNQPVSQKTRILTGRWTKIEPRDTVVFPSTTDKEATVHAIFVKNEVLGDSCLCTFVFCSGTRLVMTFLALCWHEHNQKFNSVVPYHVHWAQQDCSLDTIALTCEPVKSRGALLAVFSKNGLVLAMVINQKDPKATCVLFMNTMNFVTVFSSLKGCSSRDQQIPSRLLRSYWVGDMAWTADSLFLACMLKRGSLLLLTHTGELLTLTTSGCSVEFGPAEFIPLHPLITYRTSVPILESRDANDSLGSMASEADLLRQMFSVTCHPRLPYLIVSDGYMVTVLRFTQNLSPYYFMKSLLLDSAQRLENVRQNLQLVKPKKNGFKLRSLSSLKATLLKDPRNPPSVVSTIPSFLQDEEEICGRLEKLMTQDDDEESDDQDYAKYTAPTDGTFGRAEHGRLEFASMFDTIHASDHYMEKSDVLSNLLHIQRTMLTAWAVGVTMSNVAETNALLHYTVGCLTHFLYILQSPKCPNLKTGKLSKRTTEGNPWAAYIAIFQQCLTVLYWDVAPRQATGHMIKLTAETIKLILVQHQQLYSKSLLESYCLLKTVSQHLDAIYSLQFESTALTSAMGNVADLDSLKTPLFQAITQPPKVFPMHFVFKEPPKPVIHNAKSEKRLAVLWRLLYNQTLWYQTRLRKQISVSQSMQLAPEVQSEEKAIGFLLCHIQAELQSAGEHFNQSFRLLPVNGEEYYLLGSYKESVEFWNRELVETTTRGGRRAGILQTRFYLAVLYCYLYNYNLNDAQGMCDQLVKEMLIRSSLLTETEQEIHAGPGAGQQPFEKVRAEAALAVIQSMGRFMAAYFTNQMLYVFPPHNVRVLAPLHITTDRFPRVITLQHSVVASVVREQNLSSVWTVEYALDLLLVGGLILEAAWLANKLGDWKMSVSMAVAYNLHRETIPDESKGEVPPMPLYLSPAHTFQEKLQSFLGQPPNSETSNKGHTEPKQFTDPIEEEDADVLFSSVQEMLKAAVMTDAEILTETLHQLMESAKDLSRKLSGLVPERLYLPAPPLYCPQPSSVSEEDPSDFLLVAEKGNRQKLSGVLQRILLLLRAARCSLPAAQWYIKQIKRARKIMQKIRAKGSLPLNKALPDTLLNYANSRTVFLKAGASGNLINNLVSSSVIACFRELCALCWMLHVREQLSISCRKYQKARDNGKLFKSSDEYDSCVTEHCFEALEWACRMLPFTRVTNCEELIQDIVLSLISELPPVRKVAEIMVKAFPRPDDVRVPLREKYHSVQQRLRHSMIKGLQGEEMMSVVIHNVQRVRVKTLRRMQKNIGPLEMHVWESALDETLENELRSYDKYSLCTTSLSRSTLTDLGRPQIYSDTDTLSDGLMCTATDERTEWHIPLDRAVKRNKATGEKVREKSEMPSESGPSVPKVGTWEFECDDEEYTNFLELFLSYLLEKDLLHSSEPGIPFLTAFSQHLQEHELNSLVFDVHTTLKRKLGRPGIKSVFRAGSCYKVNTETHSDSVNMEGPLLHTHGPTEPSPALCSTVVIEKPVPSTERYFHNLRSRRSVKSGLFGLQDQRTQKISEEKHNFSLSSLPSDHTSDMYSYRLIQNKHFAPSEELGAELQAKYINEAKLVEWMIRWSDRRLFWSTGKTECHVASSTAIRVKTSSAAILTSIWLLEKPYLGSDYIHNVPPREYIIAPVIQDVENSKLQGGPSVDHLDSERGSLSTVHEQDHESEEEIVSIASSKVSRKSCERSQGRQHFIQDSSDDDTSVLREHTTVVQIPIPSETEDDKEDQLETERIPKISVSIHPVPQQMQILSIDSEHHAQDPEEPIVQEIRESPQRNEPAASASLGSPLPQSSSNAAAACPPPASSANQPESVTDGGQNTQPGNTSEAFRQLFQDEMFRLLQLQQMNFIGLMQVVGSSFAALPAMQHMLQQTSQIERNPMSNPTGGQSAPQGHASTVSGSHTSQVADVVQASTRCHDSGAGKAPHDQSNKENLQSLPELSIATNQVNDGGKIPANLGLLSTTHSQGLPLITPPPVLQKTPTLISPPRFSSLNGFPLLKLRTEPGFIQPRAEHFSRPNYRPPLREAWGPSNSAQRTTNSQPSDRVTQPPCYTGLSNTGIRIVKKAEDTKKWADIVIKGLSKHSTAYSSNSHTGTRAHQQSLKTKDRREKPEIDLFGTPQNNVGIPLLHLRTDPVLYIPTIPVPNFRGPMVPPLSKDKSDLSKITPQAALTLLKSDLPKQIQSLHISSTPRLIPLENLIAFERDAAHRGDPGTAEGSVQLLKANIQPFEEVVKAGDSMKRQKRRTLQEKGDKKEKKTTVTFRPEDSIIKPNNFDEVVKTENEHHGKQGLEEGNEFIIPLGTFKSVLSDQIPDTPLPSAAELHYMAATKKRAPDIRDASTNTDSASRSLKNTGTECEEFPSNRSAAGHPAPGASESPKPLKDTGTECEEIFSSRKASSRPAAESLLSDMHHEMPPKLFLNVRFRDDHQPEMTPTLQNSSPPTEVGHLSRLDIDSEEFLRQFPDSTDQNVPSSAELHLMAASVANVLPPELFNRREILSVDMLERPQLQERASSRTDSVTQRLLSINPSPGPKVLTPRALESNEAFSRLKEMDVQLRALQNMAESMERDFANTELLVNTIENLATVIDPDPGDTHSSGVAGRPERVLPVSDIALEELAEEDEFTLPSPAVISSHGRPLEVFISARSDKRPSTAPAQDRNMDKSTINEALQVTGLSDIADILSDLMAGGVSASELGLTQTQAENISRERLRNTSRRTQKEKAELQLWMKSKRRERLAEHRRKLEVLREQEHSPFQSQKTANTSISSKTIRQSQRVKDERDRTLLSEHHTYRVSDAISLMQDMLSEAKQIPSANPKPRISEASLSKHQGPHLAHKGSRTAMRSLSAGQAEKRRSASKAALPQPRSMSTPAWTQPRGTASFVPPKSNWEPKIKTHRVPSYSAHRKYDPSLPGDRMSQITRRGMLAGRNRTNVPSKSTKQILKTSARPFTSPRQDHKGTSPQSPHRSFPLEEAYERDSVSPWEIPDEINRILNSSRNSIQSQRSLLNGDDISHTLHLDNSSDSTGSILSKLDWKAIEDMVTSVGST